jgi:hypothetical protein
MGSKLKVFEPAINYVLAAVRLGEPALRKSSLSQLQRDKRIQKFANEVRMLPVAGDDIQTVKRLEQAVVDALSGTEVPLLAEGIRRYNKIDKNQRSNFGLTRAVVRHMSENEPALGIGGLSKLQTHPASRKVAANLRERAVVGFIGRAKVADLETEAIEAIQASGLPDSIPFLDKLITQRNDILALGSAPART